MEFTLQPSPLKMDSEQQPITGAYLKNTKDLQIGSGSKQFKISEAGIHLGAEKFAEAPFSVDMEGNGKFSGQVTITEGSGISNLTDAGALATADIVETANLGTTIITGGKIVTGLLTADNIQAGTLVGRTVKAVGGAGTDVWIANDGTLQFRYGGVIKSLVYVNTAGSMWIDADESINMYADGAGDNITLVAGQDLSLFGNKFFGIFGNDAAMYCDNWRVFYNDDNDSSDAHWYSNTNRRMVLNQDGDLTIDGNYSNSGADFAEMFEAVKEFSNKKINTGISVVLEQDKIRPALEGEIPFGVISSSPTIVGNSGGSEANENWSEKYLKDEFGAYILEEREWWSAKVKKKRYRTKKIKGKVVEEEVEREEILKGWVDEKKPIDGAKIKKIMSRKINPDYNDSKEYIPRKNRPEWNIVGLVGRLRLKKGQPTAPNWIKLRDISENVEEWLVR